MTLVRVSGSPSPRELRMTTWYGEQSGILSLLHSQPKNPERSLFDDFAKLIPILTFLWICELFPPVSPEPRYLTEATVHPQADGHRNDPDGVKKEDAG